MAHTVGQIRLAPPWSLGERNACPYRRVGQAFLGLVLGGIGGLGGGEIAMAASIPDIQEVLSAQDVLLDGDRIPDDLALTLRSTEDRLPTDDVLLAEDAQSTPDEFPPLDLDPNILEESPVLQQWLEEIPDIAQEIRHDPSFRTRLRVGYANFPSNGEIGGFQLGVEDVFLWPGTGLTASADYHRSGNGQREAYGAEVRYYLLPLGGYVNVAPSLGYRSVSAPAYNTDGLDLGLRLMVIPSRGGAADFSISQHWVAPGSEGEVGLTQFNLGYAVTRQLRLGSDLEFQNSRFGQESRWGLSLEWLL